MTRLIKAQHALQERLKKLEDCLRIIDEHSAQGRNEPVREKMFTQFVQCTNAFFEFLSTYLEAKGITPPTTTEREIIRTYELNHLINHDDHRMLIKMFEDRVKAAQGTPEHTVKNLIIAIPQYYKLMNQLMQKLSL